MAVFSGNRVNRLLLLATTAFVGNTFTLPACAATFTVVNANDSGVGSLRQALIDANAQGGSNTITINPGVGRITLASALPIIANNATIVGNNATIDGNNANRIFFVGNGTGAVAVSIQSLTLNNGSAVGGNGGTGAYGGGGGGGLGAGGAVFVSAGATVSLSNVAIPNASATGGAGGGTVLGGGYTTGGGGGGLGGAGGNGNGLGGGGGGGGGQLPTQTGGTPTGISGTGGAGGGTGGNGGNINFPGSAGGQGGGGGGNGSYGAGGATSAFGGGGGGGTGTTVFVGGPGGSGGFGGGGGGAGTNTPGTGGFAGGAGTNDVSGLSTGNGGGGGGALGGAIFVQQGGTLNVVGAFSQTTGTVVGGAGGSAGAGNGSAFGSGLFLQGNGTISFSPGAGQSQTIAGAIADQSGSGGTGTNAGSYALRQVGAGTLVLSGTNTYTGGTTFGAGVINAGSAGALGTVGALSFTGGTLQYSAASAATDLSGRFSGAANQLYSIDTNGQSVTYATALASQGGTLTKLGAGTLTSTAANTFTGATTIGAGTLALAGTGSISRSSSVALATGGTFDISRLTNGGTSITSLGNTATGQTGTVALGANILTLTNAAGTFGGAIAGTGGLTLAAGTQVLTGASTYTGATTINGGTLQVDGSIASPNVVVNNGGVLSGTGKIGDPLIAAGGTLSPGNAANPTGTLTIVGPLTFAAGSYYNVTITPNANSRTNVVGTTTINGGTVIVTSARALPANKTYTILTSTGGFTGRFDPMPISRFAFIQATLSYDANDVYLTNRTNYVVSGATQNQTNVGAGLNAATRGASGTGRKVLNALNQVPTAQGRAVLDALSGEGLTAAQNIANRSAELFNSSIFDQTTFYGSGNAANSITLTEPIRELADLPSHAAPPLFVQPNRTWRAWATGFGGVDDIHGNGTVGSSYQQNTIYGGTLGVDYQLTPNYLVGVAIGGTNGDFLVPGRATSGSTTGGHVAFYDLATFGSFYGASSTSFSYFGNRATRTVSGFGGLGTETERANFNSNELRTRLEFGRHLAGYGGVLTPFVALELAQLRSNGFTESSVQGAGLFRLNVSGQSQASAPAFVGLRLQRATSLGNGITLSPTLQVAYVHEFAPYRSQIGTLADLPGSTFLVDGARPARNAAQVKAGAEMAIGARSMIFANFDGEFSGVNQLYAGKGGFRYVW